MPESDPRWRAPSHSTPLEELSSRLLSGKRHRKALSIARMRPRRRQTRAAVSSGNHVLTLDEAAGVLARHDVLERDIALQRAKERDPGTDQHRNAGDNEALNQPSLKKPLNWDPAIHINMLDAAGGKLRHDDGRSPRQPLHYRAERRSGERASAEHEHPLLTIGPRLKGQNRLERLAAYDQRIHRRHEFVVAVGFATAWWQEVEIAVGSSDEAVEAGANKDGCLHCRILMLPPKQRIVPVAGRHLSAPTSAKREVGRSEPSAATSFCAIPDDANQQWPCVRDRPCEQTRNP